MRWRSRVSVGLLGSIQLDFRDGCSWEFSDGSEAVTGVPEEGATTVNALHIYENYRPEPYYVTLSVTADSEAGSVEGTATIEVFVNEAEGFVITGWSAQDNLKSAIRALSGFAQAAGTVIIWVVIFIPVWVVVGVVIYLFVRLRTRLWLNLRRQGRSESGGGWGFLSRGRDGDAGEQS